MRSGGSLRIDDRIQAVEPFRGFGLVNVGELMDLGIVLHCVLRTLTDSR